MTSALQKYYGSYSNPKNPVKCGILFNFIEVIATVVGCKVLQINCNIIAPLLLNTFAFLLASYGCYAKKRHYIYAYVFAIVMKIVEAPTKENFGESMLRQYMIEKEMEEFWISLATTVLDMMLVAYVVLEIHFVVMTASFCIFKCNQRDNADVELQDIAATG